MPSTPAAYPQVVSRTFASFRVPKVGVSAAHDDFGVCSRSNFRAVLMSVDGINTFGVSAGHFASLGVRIAVQMPQTGKRQVGRRPVGSMAGGAAKHDPLRVKS
jgi:hypothetical protein